MGLPTEADLQAAIGKALIQDKELFAYLATQTNNFVSREAAYLLAIPSDSSPGAESGQQRLRSILAQSVGLTAERCAPLWATYSRVAALPPNEPFWPRLFRYFHDNSKTVKSRAFSFGSWSAGGSNVGTGSIYRLSVDQYNYTIEAGFAETKTAECVQDANSGARRHEELFRVRGAAAGRDALERIGTGRAIDVRCLSPQSSATLVPNCSFENISGTTGAAGLTGIDSWTVLSGAFTNVETVTSDYYRDVPGATTNRSLRFSGNETVYQTFDSLSALKNWDPNIPLFAQIAFKRESSCDGTLRLIIGGITASVTLAAQSGWTILTFPITTNAWFRQWNASAASGSLSNMAVKIQLLSRTTGTLLVDDLIIGPYAQVDGAWVALVSGQTPFLQRDTFTATDTSSDTGLIQTVLARTQGLYLPHTSGSPTWADPT